MGVGIREFRVPDAKVWYSGSEKATEQIKISGKVTEPIKVHVSIQCSLSNGVTCPCKGNKRGRNLLPVQLN